MDKSDYDYFWEMPDERFAPGRIFMGLETEYGFPDLQNLCALLQSVSLRGDFLDNGARLYQDCAKPEYCTPECENPMDLVACASAGDKLLARPGFLVYRSNVQYEPFCSWGSHENYFIPITGALAEMESGSRLLDSFLASRVLISGAGGIVPAHVPEVPVPAGWRVLDGRMLALAMSETRFGSHSWGIKSDGLYRRLQIHCNGTNCSETSLYLRFATMAMFLSALANDRGFARDLMIPGMQPRPAKECNCDSCVATRGGRIVVRHLDQVWLNAALNQKITTNSGEIAPLQLQREFLWLIGSHRGPMPSWAPVALAKWKEALDLVEAGEAHATLDWAIKAAISRKIDDYSRMCEFEAMYGKLGDGIFDKLDGSGVLDHRVVSDRRRRLRVSLRVPPTRRGKQRAIFLARSAERGKRDARYMYETDWGFIHCRDGTRSACLDIATPVGAPREVFAEFMGWFK